MPRRFTHKGLKPAAFIATALAVIIVAVFVSILGLRWLSGLYDPALDRYGMWLSLEILLSSFAFGLFILMASRRLKSDRFTAEDFTPEIYTPIGIRWVNDTSMKDVLLRHHPELAGSLYGTDNAFKPWTSS